jgi:hypothetical protein
VSRILSLSSALVLLAACGVEGRLYTYTLDAEIVIPDDVARRIETPALVQVEWMGEMHGPALICEPLDGELRVDFFGEVDTAGHMSNQAFSAGVVRWPDEKPCDPELVGTFSIGGQLDVPYVHATVFPDELGPLGFREKDRAESITVEVAYHD